MSLESRRGCTGWLTVPDIPAQRSCQSFVICRATGASRRVFAKRSAVWTRSWRFCEAREVHDDGPYEMCQALIPGTRGCLHMLTVRGKMTRKRRRRIPASCENSPTAGPKRGLYESVLGISREAGCYFAPIMISWLSCARVDAQRCELVMIIGFFYARCVDTKIELCMSICRMRVIYGSLSA